MEHSTTDVRDLDCLYLATIGGCDYFETRQIVRQENGVRRVVGLASAWPVIEARAQRDEYASFVAAFARMQADADNQLLEARAREHTYLDHIAALEACLAEQAAAQTAADIAAHPTEFVVEPVPPQVEALVTRLTQPRDDGRIPCDHPGCMDWVKPRGLPAHKRQAHGVAGLIGHKPSEAADSSPSMDERRKCPHCKARPRLSELNSHIVRLHATQATVAPAPIITPIALALGERPWECDHCHEATHARSLAQPTLCIRCVAARADTILTNGRLAAA